MEKTAETKRINDDEMYERWQCWEDLEINNNVLKALGWLIEGFDFDRVPVEDFLGDGIGGIIEMYLEKQKKIVAEYVPKLKEEMLSEEVS